LAKVSPSQWNKHKDYQKLKDFVDNLRVTNDSAKLGVALNTDYIKAITKDELQRQHLFQTPNCGAAQKTGSQCQEGFNFLIKTFVK
jgi:hypothetical protein